MRVLFVSGELISGDLAYRLQEEDCSVKLYIEDPGMKECFDGVVKKTDNWRNELNWVGKNGLIVFDDVGYGNDQDELRKKGYSVIGGSSDGDKLEQDRVYAQKILISSGVISEDFKTKSSTVNSAIRFIKKNKGEWVVKPNNHDTSLSYVGCMKDGSDVLNILENYKTKFGGSCIVSLQKRVRGIEIAIGRFFNGKNWVGPSIINFEHKHLNNDDIGLLGGETGTLMWYESNENNKLFQKTLAKIKSHLQKSDYKGYIDINCIVSDKNTVYPLEITSRFGSSTIETQCEIQVSPWSNFFVSLANGTDFNLDYKAGYAINIGLTVPPFPYRTTDKNIIFSGANIFFEKGMSKKEFSHIHFEGVLSKKIRGKRSYFTAGNLGYVLYVTRLGKTVHDAREKAYTTVSKIIIPKMLYRTDIGLRFINNDQKVLKDWGWIT